MKIIKTVFWGTLIIIFFIAVAQIMDGTNTSTPTNTRTHIPAHKEVKKADPEMQKKRLDFITKMGEIGLVERIEVENGVGKLWITNKFLLLSEKEQNELLNVPFAYVVDELGKDPMFVAFILKMDNGTPLGKRVGEYKPLSGVNFYK